MSLIKCPLSVTYGHFLLYSYAYYVKNLSLTKDEDFDSLCVSLLTNWDKWEHQHKYLISKADLAAGTGYSIKYPQRLINTFENTIAAWKRGDKWVEELIPLKP